jgi:large subunit ribosomal protein L13
MIANGGYHLAFEGLAHPYEENIIKIGNKSVIAELPEVKEAFLKAKTEA